MSTSNRMSYWAGAPWRRTLPGSPQGATLEEARANLHEAVALVLEANRTLAQETAGKDVIREPFKVTA